MAKRKIVPKVEEIQPVQEVKEIQIPEVEEIQIPEVEETRVPEIFSSRRKRYVAIGRNQRHPFQNEWIHTTLPGTLLDEDSWLISQIERGLVKEA